MRTTVIILDETKIRGLKAVLSIKPEIWYLNQEKRLKRDGKKTPR